MSRLDDKQAWFVLVQPLLASETAFIESPPELATTQPVTTPIEVEAKTKSIRSLTGMTTYEGAVHVKHRAAGDCLRFAGGGWRHCPRNDDAHRHGKRAHAQGRAVLTTLPPTTLRSMPTPECFPSAATCA